MLRRTQLFFLSLLFCPSLLQAQLPLTVLVEPYPPFVIEKEGILSGPYIDVFNQLMQKQEIAFTIKSSPVRRSLQVAQERPNTCIMALNYAPEYAEVLLYIGRITPIYVWAYARHGEHSEIHNLTDLFLQPYKIAIADLAEIREIFDEKAIDHVVLQQNISGLTMLNSHRFDLLISDISSDTQAHSAKASADKLFMLIKIERWFACNPNTTPAIIVQLRTALHEGFFPNSSEKIWIKNGLGDYYKQVRKEWTALKPS